MYNISQKCHFLIPIVWEADFIGRLPKKGEILSYNKYKNVKVNIDGFKFDSMAESERYKELKMLNKAGLITNLTLQPKFELQSKFRHNGKAERAIYYIADFSYSDISEEKIIVEDVKGIETDVFQLKRKMFLKLYGETHELKIVR